jgi:hypothetical protein
MGTFSRLTLFSRLAFTLNAIFSETIASAGDCKPMPLFSKFAGHRGLRKMDGRGCAQRRGRDVQLRRLVCGLLFAGGLAACSQEPDYTPEQRICIAQRYSAYDPRQLNQCVDVCKMCMKGNTVTCHTACRLRGAG